MPHLPADLFETIRNLLLRQSLGARSPLLSAITWQGAPREFTVNMLATLARDKDALDALIDVAKDQVGTDVADEIESLRATLHVWAQAGANTTALLPISPNAEKRSVFISYERRNGREFAAELRAELAPTFHIWQDVVALQGGEGWWEQIKAAIEGIDTLVLVITERALLSQIVPVVRDARAGRRRDSAGARAG